MKVLFIIGAGGFFGAISRYLISEWVAKTFIGILPIGTLSVNAIGSFLIGFFALFFEKFLYPEYKYLIIAGFLGSLTTFSTFSLQTFLLFQSGNYQIGFLNIALNIIVCLIFTYFGMTFFNGIKG